MTNKHCDFIFFDEAENLREKLQLSKKDFANLCGVSYAQFQYWRKKNRMPEYRLSKLKEAIFLQAKKQFDETVKILEEC